ncbi:alkaline shock response membrane anchor protein AmaP [Streptomyces sp. CC228A]|uniref:alkaline shock response membrane anchor protein AmaP n=1 Tax=Streptomyces sp. CC228A TaxID=2898186 RepID=UPI001F422ABF|nr:alkaline shock response membrane anchor protein AmaP [Streptomyces sp. CC228A]
MTRHLDRANRIALALIGLVLLAGGVLALLYGWGVLGQGGPSEPLLTPGERRYAASSSWVWPLIGLAGALAAVLGLLAAVAQLRPDGVRSLPLEADRSRGATTLSADAVTDALEEEIESYGGVQRATARLTRSSHYPHLVLRVTLAAEAEVRTALERIQSEALPHLRDFLDQPELPARVRLHVAR